MACQLLQIDREIYLFIKHSNLQLNYVFWQSGLVCAREKKRAKDPGRVGIGQHTSRANL